MKTFLTTLMLFCFIISNHSTAYEASSETLSFKQAKRLMFTKIYIDYRKTIYCNVEFDGNNMITLDGFTSSKYIDRSTKLEWEHVVPAENFGKALQVWENDDSRCSNDNNRDCARKISPEFKQMEADMHNIFPVVGSVNAMRSNYNFVASVEDHEAQPFSECDIKVGRRKVVPPKHAKGVIARAYLYMEDRYKDYGYNMSSSQRKLMQAWNKTYPVDHWECIRDDRIARIQGNHNKFIHDKCINFHIASYD